MFRFKKSPKIFKFNLTIRSYIKNTDILNNKSKKLREVLIKIFFFEPLSLSSLNAKKSKYINFLFTLFNLF